MKWFWRIFLTLVAIVLLAIGFIYFKGRSTRPITEGELQLTGLSAPVEVQFDDFGIPFIKASNKADMYRAFGYVHAQDRLFQMELLRRAGGGRLSEIIGEPMIKVDKMFHTIGLPEYAAQSAREALKAGNQEMLRDIESYLSGINAFIREKRFSPEFSLMNFEPEPFTLEDMYKITGAMAFSFSQAQKTEPVVSTMFANYGLQALNDLGIGHQPEESFIPNYDTRNDTLLKSIAALSKSSEEVSNALPFSPLEGSNSWVLSPEKTKSKSVLFCNDTHIGYLIPQTWYEASIECPGFKMYGHFMAAIPFALVGRNDQLSWGLTMLLNDDMDFYFESGDSSKFEKKTIEIKVKDSPNVPHTIYTSPRGPIVNQSFDHLSSSSSISMRWLYTQQENKTIDAFYQLNNSQNIKDFESALPLIHAPGLSINYGDNEGNIAWWACAHLIKRKSPETAYLVTFSNDSIDPWAGYFTFSENPKSINPPTGFIYSANDQIQMPHEEKQFYPGYYKPQYRADRIRKLLNPSDTWNVETMKNVMTDITSDADVELLNKIKEIIHSDLDERNRDIYGSVWEWDGTYTEESYGSTFFTKLLYHYMKATLEDEMGSDLFKTFLSSHLAQRTQLHLIDQENSPFWDDISTPNVKENRKDVLLQAYKKSIEQLTAQFGENPKVWNWRKACTLELKHPLGEVALLRPLFNIGPQSVAGSNETIMQSGFLLNESGEYKVYFGSQMRIIYDFGNPNESVNITPGGQSGHRFSQHYKDQFELYTNKEFRKMGSFSENNKVLKLIP